MSEKILILSELQGEVSFYIEEGNVIFLFELSKVTIDYFKSNKDILRNISDVFIIITDTRPAIKDLENELYGIIKSYNEKIYVNVLSKSQYEYCETDSKYVVQRQDLFYNTYIVKTNNFTVRINLTDKFPYRVLFEILPIHRPLMYFGVSGKVYDHEIPYLMSNKKLNIVYTINRDLYDDKNISTKNLFDRICEIYGEKIFDMIILGYKNKIEGNYFRDKIHNMWIPKKGYRPTEMNTTLEKALVTSSFKEGEYNEHFSSRRG